HRRLRMRGPMGATRGVGRQNETEEWSAPMRTGPLKRLPSRVVQPHLVALLVTIPSTGRRGDVTQLLGVRWRGDRAAMLRECRPTLKADAFRPRGKVNRLTVCNGTPPRRFETQFT